MRRHLFTLCLLFAVGCDDGSGDSGDGQVGDDSGGNRPIGDARVDDGGADQGAGEDAGPGDDGGGPGDDAGSGEVPACPPNSNYGLLAFPRAVFPADAAQSSPRAVWGGQEWGVVWQQASETAGVNEVVFQRVGSDGRPLGEPQKLGEARLPQHEVAWTGAGYVAVWAQTRTDAGGVDGVRVRFIDADGQPAQTPLDLPASFDVNHLAIAWAPLGGGMIAYTRGRNGEGGLYLTPVDEASQLRATQRLAETPTLSPAVVFGDGAWGVAWLDRSSAMPSDLVFVVVNDGAQPVSNVRRMENAGAQGNVHLAFGLSTFGVGWSRLDPMGTLKPFVTLFDSAGDVLATPPIPGPEGFGLVTDMAWLDPNFFGVAWQDNRTDAVRVGLTRVNTNGQVADPVVVPLEPGARHSALSVAGNVTRAGGWFAGDPNPQPGGVPSSDVRVQFAPIGVCR